MTTPELERALTDTLHRHAEVAMSRTDTHEQLIEHHARVDAPSGGHRRRRLLTTAAAAAAAVALAGVWLHDVAGGGNDETADSSERLTTAERTAGELLEAYTAGEVAGVVALLADDATMPAGWRGELVRTRAWSFDYDLHPCETLSTSDFGTGMVCPFDYHAYHSAQLGLAPFGNNTFSVVVDDGEVVSLLASYNYRSNGDQRLYRRIGAWIRANHPGEWQFLDSDAARAAEPKRWVSLWQRRTQEYVAARTG